jgi:hypothetical protein
VEVRLFMPPKLGDTEKILIVLTSLALNAPSAYTIAWSKDDPEKRKHYPILLAGIGTSAVTLIGAFTNDWILWAGLIGSLSLFGYTVLFYNSQPKKGIPSSDYSRQLQIWSKPGL